MPGLAVAILSAVAAYLVLGEPFVGAYLFEKLRTTATADPKARSRFYRGIILLEWALVGLVLLGLWLDRVPLSAIGLSPVREGLADFLTGFSLPILVAPVAVFLLVRFLPKVRAAYAARMAPVAPMMPVTGTERLQMALTSVTAGICEALLFRGFLIYFIGQMLPGVPLWGALAIVTVVFGFAHWYQGWSGVLGTAAVGAVLGGLYWFTGSLYPSMLLHAVIDLNAVGVAWVLAAGGAQPDAVAPQRLHKQDR